MDISRLIGPGFARCRIEASSKKDVLRQIADVAAPLLKIGSDTIYDALLHRERLGTTGLGQGIAIPHARLEGVTQMRGCLVTLQSPVDFDAVDGKPVDLFFALFAPEDAGSDHLNALVQASRLLRDAGMTQHLRAATSDDMLHAVATRPLDQKNAA